MSNKFMHVSPGTFAYELWCFGALLVTGQCEHDWNNTKMQQSKLFLVYNKPVSVCFTWHASGVLCGVECLSRLCSVSREWQRTDSDRQVETETTEGIETQLDTQSCMSKSIHARASWTCTNSHTAHTARKWYTRQWLRCCSCPHIHVPWSGTSELMQSCLKLQRMSKTFRARAHIRAWAHTPAHEWTVDFTLLP